MNPIWILLLIFGPFLVLCACILYFVIPANDPVIYQGEYEQTRIDRKIVGVAVAAWAALPILIFVIAGVRFALFTALLLLLLLVAGTGGMTVGENFRQSLINRKRSREGLSPLPPLPSFVQRCAWNIELVLVRVPLLMLHQ